MNFSDYGLQLTRMSRAVKLWLSLSYFGVDAFRDAIDRCLDLARLAQAHVEDHPALELVLPATLGVVCFRRVAPDAVERTLEALNVDLVAWPTTASASSPRPGCTAGWPCRRDPATLATLGLFQGVEPAVLDQAAGAAREVVATTGDVLVRQWDAARELYVILEGSARVHRGETELRHLAVGDHFGEPGALDWGSSFSYPPRPR